MIKESCTTAKAGTAQPEEELTQMGYDRDKVLSALKKTARHQRLVYSENEGLSNKDSRNKVQNRGWFLSYTWDDLPPTTAMPG